MLQGGVVFRRRSGAPTGAATAVRSARVPEGPGWGGGVGGGAPDEEEELCFVPASIALKVMPVPSIGRVPGGPPELRGVALVDGDMIAIVEAGAPSSPPLDGRTDAMLVCSVLGEQVGLVGIQVVATGKFPAREGGDVEFEDKTARAFDVARLIAKVREGRWGVTLSE